MEVRYYATPRKKLSVLEYIQSINQRKERAECYEIIKGLEEDTAVWGRGADIDHLGKGLYELRPGRHRILFGIVNEMAILLCAVPKKGRKLKKWELDLARKRLKEVQDALM